MIWIESILMMVFISLFNVNCQRQTKLGKFVANSNFDLTKLNSDYSVFNDLIQPIAKVRVSGTRGNIQVRKYLADKMKSYGWLIQTQNFNASTPYGVKNFENVIANYPIGKTFSSINNDNDNQKFYLKNRVTLACHYDSKYFQDIEFIGAIDSAVPCALLLDLAKFLNENFKTSYFSKLNRHLQFIFFDGEEAFKDWSSTDSIYGSRNLVNSLASNYGQNSFDTIDLFVLLDLIGASSSQFPNFFPDSTSKSYIVMNKIEKMLISKSMLSSKTVYYFSDLTGNGKYSQVEDDHIPWKNKNVPILHLIPIPFPSQWHTKDDNLKNLNKDRIQDLRLIFKSFIMQILNKNQDMSNSNEEL